MSVYGERANGFEDGQDARTRPACVIDDHLEFLDVLRESGATNMMAATPYLMNAFSFLTIREASTILAYWMKTFGNDDR